jgi:hypothetical protein
MRLEETYERPKEGCEGKSESRVELRPCSYDMIDYPGIGFDNSISRGFYKITEKGVRILRESSGKFVN